MENKKKESMETTIQKFAELEDDNKMFILGYMMGVQKEKERLLLLGGDEPSGRKTA